MSENSIPHERHTSRWAVGVTCSVFVLLLVVGGVMALRDQLLAQAQADARAQTKEREKLADRLNQLQTTVDALAGAPKFDAAVLQPLTDQVGETSSQLDELAERIELLEKKAEALKAEPVPAVAAPAFVAEPAADASYLALKTAVMAQKPFTEELAAWKQNHAENTQDIHALVKTAEAGLTRESELIRQLQETLAGLSRMPEPEQTSLIGRINSHLHGLVSIKKSPPLDAYATLRADALREDLATLMREAERLPPEARQPLEAWLEAAHARIAALDTLATLNPATGR